MAGSSLGRYQAIFREDAFRWFWLGFTGSALGDTMTRVAMTWFVYQATGSAAALGGLLVAYSGPIIVGGLVAGWLLDRYDRRQVMFVDSVVRGIAVSAIPLLFIVGRLQVWAGAAERLLLDQLRACSLPRPFTLLDLQVVDQVAAWLFDRLLTLD